MNSAERNIWKAWEMAIERETPSGRTAQISKASSLSGGCINDAKRIELTDGRKYFVKSNAAVGVELFTSEAMGLDALRRAGALRVPEVIAVGESPNPFLILEFIETGRSSRDYDEQLGRQLGLLHQTDVGKQYGFFADNYIGATPQPNPMEDNWIRFWTRRLQFQFDLARQHGRGTTQLQRAGERLIDSLETHLGDSPEPPALLHGDLWSGNHMADANGSPVLVDPACYFGDREAEFGMISLFGGVSDKFYAAYNEVYPLRAGSEPRIAIYRLYHVLNHLNLFGDSYLDGCLQILRRFSSNKT